MIDADRGATLCEGDVVAVVGRRTSVVGAEAAIGEERRIWSCSISRFRPWTWSSPTSTSRDSLSCNSPAKPVEEFDSKACTAGTRGIVLCRYDRWGDTLQVLGAPSNVQRVAKEAGYAERPTPDADLTWLAAGIVLGVLIGIPALMFKGVAIGLGTSGGVLVMGLILGYLRAVYPVFGKLPAAAGWLLETLGLNTFIAIVGLGAGLSFVSGLKTFGVPLLLSGILAVLIPHTLTLLIGKRFFPGINRGVLVGICCGSGTNTRRFWPRRKRRRARFPSWVTQFRMPSEMC